MSDRQPVALFASLCTLTLYVQRVLNGHPFLRNADPLAPRWRLSCPRSSFYSSGPSATSSKPTRKQMVSFTRRGITFFSNHSLQAPPFVNTTSALQRSSPFSPFVRKSSTARSRPPSMTPDAHFTGPTLASTARVLPTTRIGIARLLAFTSITTSTQRTAFTLATTTCPTTPLPLPRTIQTVRGL